MTERITVMISGWAKPGDNGVNVSGVVQKPVTMPAPPVLKSIAFAAVIALSACTPSTATHHALHEGRDVEAVAGMVDAPGVNEGSGFNE